MEYRLLGGTGLSVSEIGMGCEGFEEKTEREAADFIRRAVDSGINYFDIYISNPDVRSKYGAGFAGIRDKVLIEGHLGADWQDGQYKRTRSLARTKASFDDLLARLGTDYIDVGMIHYIDRQEDFDTVFGGEIIEYAKQLKKEGKIRHIGVSSHNPAVARQAVETGLVEVLLFSINPAYDMQPPGENLEQLWADEAYVDPLININPERESLYERAAVLGVGITVMKAYGGGDLLSAEMSPYGVALTPVQCLSYALTRPGVSTVCAGMKTEAEMDAALAYTAASAAERDYSVALSTLPKHTFEGRCMYCGHCAPCTAGIDIASVNKYLNLALVQKTIPETVREHYAALTAHAGDCVACGVCETNCPFSVEIVKKMHEASRLFGG